MRKPLDMDEEEVLTLVTIIQGFHWNAVPLNHQPSRASFSMLSVVHFSPKNVWSLPHWASQKIISNAQNSKVLFPLNSFPFHWESNFEVLEHTVTGHMLYSIDYCCCQLFLVPKINVPQKMQWHMFLQQQLCRNFLCQDLCQRLLLWCV